MLRELRGNACDLAMEACNGSQSGRLLLAVVRAHFKLGFPDATTNSASAWRNWSCPEHLARRSVQLLRIACAGGADRPCFPLKLSLSEMERAQA